MILLRQMSYNIHIPSHLRYLFNVFLSIDEGLGLGLGLRLGVFKVSPSIDKGLGLGLGLGIFKVSPSIG